MTLTNKDFIPVIKDIDNKAFQFMEWLKAYHLGKETPIMARDMPQWGHQRVIRKIVHYLRSNGYPICSSCRGYFYASTEEELQEAIDFVVCTHKMEAYHGLLNSFDKIHSQQ